LSSRFLRKPPTWPYETSGQACHNGEFAIAAEVLMNNVG